MWERAPTCAQSCGEGGRGAGWSHHQQIPGHQQAGRGHPLSQGHSPHQGHPLGQGHSPHQSHGPPHPPHHQPAPHHHYQPAALQALQAVQAVQVAGKLGQQGLGQEDVVGDWVDRLDKTLHTDYAVPAV